VRYPKLEVLNLPQIQAWKAFPHWGKPKGTIIYISDRQETFKTAFQSTLQPLARNGWSTYFFYFSPYPSDAIHQLSVALQSITESNGLSKPCFLTSKTTGNYILKTTFRESSLKHTTPYSLPEIKLPWVFTQSLPPASSIPHNPSDYACLYRDLVAISSILFL